MDGKGGRTCACTHTHILNAKSPNDSITVIVL